MTIYAAQSEVDITININLIFIFKIFKKWFIFMDITNGASTLKNGVKFRDLATVQV